MKLEYKPYTLQFKFPAGTSRGVMREHRIFIIAISEEGTGAFGLGEAAPLPGLSPETFAEVSDHLPEVQRRIETMKIPTSRKEAFHLARELSGEFPSLRFALETALLDLMNGGHRLIFNNAFSMEEKPIPINGLVWMGKKSFMIEQIDEKVAEGFDCIKMKVGALDFSVECEVLDYLRSQGDDIIIRVDANGGFRNEEVFSRLRTLEQFGIHSIEQPILPSQLEAMQLICLKSPVPVALDEELVGVKEKEGKRQLLEFLKPRFIILKPTLLGGFQSCLEWIEEAERLNIGWWITSALESNIGLNAVCQFAAECNCRGHQGLGTGSLYINNFKSPLHLEAGQIRTRQTLGWDVPW